MNSTYTYFKRNKDIATLIDFGEKTATLADIPRYELDLKCEGIILTTIVGEYNKVGWAMRWLNKHGFTPVEG